MNVHFAWRSGVAPPCVLALCLSLLPGIGAPPVQKAPAAQIRAIARFYQKYNRFNGALLVAQRGTILYEGAFGLANMEWNIPNRIDTKFLLGSVTKQFTAMLVMQLVQEGRIRLDASVTTYLPDYRRDTGSLITIRELLTHTSGLPNYTDLPGFIPGEIRNHYSVDEFVKKFCSGDLQFAPGTHYNYSNSGYYLLGAIIEHVTGKSYAQVLQNRIFRPLGMKSSGFYDTTPLITDRAAGYVQTLNGYENAPFQDMSIPFSAGAIYSTVEDLYRWDRALHDRRLLSAEYTRMMFTPYLNGYAFGWRVGPQHIGSTNRTVEAIYHGGDIFGFDTTIIRIPGDQGFIVILDNAMQRTYIDEMSRDILGVLYGAPPTLKPPIGEVLRKTLRNHHAADVVAQYARLRAAHKGDYDFSESELNILGYELIGAKRFEDAVAIMRLNANEYPNSWNAYDSLGEAYRDAGDVKDSIDSYKRSLDLNPKNANAANVLRQLERVPS